MGRFLVIVWACVLTCQFANGKPVFDGDFELRVGNCSRAALVDLVFQDHVHLTRLPFVSRSTTSSWKGDQKIYCILALSEKEESKGSTVAIKEGGLNHTFVTLEFHSAKNHGLEYNVQVYGKLQ